MKPFTVILFCALAAFAAASWGGLIQWWQSVTLWKKMRFCFFVWLFLLLLSIKAGGGWIIAAIVSGEAGLLICVFLTLNKIFDEWQEME